MPKCPVGETWDLKEKRCRPKKTPGRGGWHSFAPAPNKPLIIVPVKYQHYENNKTK